MKSSAVSLIIQGMLVKIIMTNLEGGAVIEATIYEAKTKLSDLVKRAQAGEEVIITSGRAKTPVARIVSLPDAKRKGRPLDLFKGLFTVGPEFDDPLPEDELRLWNGEGD
jgi:prevent-host-death family protein